MNRQQRPFLSLNHATFRLGDRLVFQDSCWVFGNGEQWAIVGANGSGKSLLGDAVRARLPLVAGELVYGFSPPPGITAEECIGHVSFEERKANVRETVVQSRWNSLEDESGLRVQEFLGFERVMDINPFELSKTRRRERRQFEVRKRKAIQLSHLQPFLERRLLTLSNGEMQRVQLARELCRPLRLLILDEPFTGLDAENRRYIREVLERLMRTSLRVLVITTRPEDLPVGITHVMEVNECKIVFAGPRRAFSNPNRCRNRSRNHLTLRRNEKKAITTGTPWKSSLPNLPTKEKAITTRITTAITIKSSEELVRMRDVIVVYGARTILDGINWSIREGESWALLGPNGSGKTTLLSLILGDNPQVYRNEVFVFGKRRGSGESIWEIKKRIGWVSPELQLHFDDSTTCLEAVKSGFRDTVGLFEPPTARQSRDARQWLARFGLLEMGSEPLFALSAGLQRMVLLARALVKRPRLLILDEPCQGLDAEHRELFVRVVDELLRNGGETAIYVTHRQEEIPPSINRVLKLRVRS
jgi:molybdate transport system ATP-binding protein